MALEPFVQACERRGLRRSHAVGVAFGLVSLFVALLALLAVPPLAAELTRFARDLPNLVDDLSQGHGRLGFVEQRFHVVERARSAVSSHGAGDLAGGGPAVGVLRNIVGTGAAIVAVAFLTLFVSLGGRSWFESFLTVLPASARPRVARTGQGISGAVGGYVAGNLFISVIAGGVTTLVCSPPACRSRSRWGSSWRSST